MSEEDLTLFCIKVSPKDNSRKSQLVRPAEYSVTRNKTAAALSSAHFCKKKNRHQSWPRRHYKIDTSEISLASKYLNNRTKYTVPNAS